MTTRFPRRTLQIATVLSALGLLFTPGLLTAGRFLPANEYHLSFGPNFHVGVISTGFDSRLVFFNDSQYGPYRGSIIGLGGTGGELADPFPRLRRFGDTWGIYYRHIKRPDAQLWTLAVSLWYAVAIFATLPAVWLVSLTILCSTRAAK